MSEIPPAFVKNPVSLQHMVWLNPGQSLIVELGEDLYPSPEVEQTGCYLELEDSKKVGGQHLWRFKVREDVSDWAKYSSVFLGEIWIGTASSIAKLCVVMAGNNEKKREHIAIINPLCYDVRLKPSNIAEFILFDDSLGINATWDWTWKETSRNSQLMEIGYDTLEVYPQALELDFPNQTYARCSRADLDIRDYCRQHHFWFRFEHGILNQLDLETVLHVGDILFIGKGNVETVTYRASIFVDLRRKYRERAQRTMEIERHHLPKIAKKSHHPQVSNLVYQPKKPTPMMRGVEISLCDEKKIDFGCRTVSATPTTGFSSKYAELIELEDEWTSSMWAYLRGDNIME